jgi:flavin reductase (DIM6/NTAB) family NADH-FMN oxidoreductase RutF
MRRTPHSVVAQPLVACIVSNRDFSFTALRRTGECVIAIPAVDLARPVVGIGNCSGRDTDKFEAFKFVVDGEIIRLRSRMP